MIGTLPHNARFDLHMHSDLSDGRYAPEEVLRRCAKGGLDVVALTDHDLATTVQPGPREIKGRTLHVIAGAEVSATHEGAEYHLLVYFPADIPDAFRDFSRAQCRERAARYLATVESLGLPDIPAPPAEALLGDRAITRLHLARSLVDAGHARTLRDAFDQFLSRSHGHVPSIALTMADAIAMARAGGGITSWAHPPVAAVKQHIASLAAAGLQGIEALRPYVSSKDRSFYRKAAHKHGLYLTGGSDWHGWANQDLGLFRVERRELGDFVDALVAA